MTTKNNLSLEDKQPVAQGQFVAMLQAKTGGVTLPQIDEEIAALVRQIVATRRPGKFTYTLKISPNAKAGVKIEDEVKVTMPRAETGVSFFFASEDGALLRNDPNQVEMKFAVVPNEQAAAPKVVVL